eukprot:gene4319-4572_t
MSRWNRLDDDAHDEQKADNRAASGLAASPSLANAAVVQLQQLMQLPPVPPVMGPKLAAALA